MRALAVTDAGIEWLRGACHFGIDVDRLRMLRRYKRGTRHNMRAFGELRLYVLNHIGYLQRRNVGSECARLCGECLRSYLDRRGNDKRGREL